MFDSAISQPICHVKARFQIFEEDNGEKIRAKDLDSFSTENK
jgi:hypothetical protein